MKPSKDLDEQIDEILHKHGAEEGEFTYSIRQQLLALIEQREREARIDELRILHATYIWNEAVADYMSERIAELKEGEK